MEVASPAKKSPAKKKQRKAAGVLDRHDDMIMAAALAFQQSEVPVAAVLQPSLVPVQVPS